MRTRAWGVGRYASPRSLAQVRCVLQCVAVFAGLANEDWHYNNLAVILQRRISSAVLNQCSGIALDLMDELADIRSFCMHYSTVALRKVTSLWAVERSGCEDT